MSVIQKITGVILAGGLSRRMGKDKRTIDFNGFTILERTILLFNQIFSQVLVVYGRNNSLELKGNFNSVEDIYPNCGSIGGLFTGLRFSPMEHIFVVGCDMPFLKKDLIRLICEKGKRFDVFMPKIKSQVHPLHGVYSKSCLPYFERMILEKNLKIQQILNVEELKIGFIQDNEIKNFDPDFFSIMNLNTPEDLEKAINIKHKMEDHGKGTNSRGRFS